MFKVLFNSVDFETNMEEIVPQGTVEITYQEYAFHDLKLICFCCLILLEVEDITHINNT